MRKHGLVNNKIYYVWTGIRKRCNHKGHLKYHRYGGRGIKICKEWDDFLNFYNWALESGYREGLYISRIDINGDYTPENCQWSTPLENSRNKENSIKIKGVPLVDVAKQLNIPYGMAYNNYIKGRPLDAPNKIIKVDGKTLTQIARETGLKRGTLDRRYSTGYRTMELLTRPLNSRADSFS